MVLQKSTKHYCGAVSGYPRDQSTGAGLERKDLNEACWRLWK